MNSMGIGTLGSTPVDHFKVAPKNEGIGSGAVRVPKRNEAICEIDLCDEKVDEAVESNEDSGGFASLINKASGYASSLATSATSIASNFLTSRLVTNQELPKIPTNDLPSKTSKSTPLGSFKTSMSLPKKQGNNKSLVNTDDESNPDFIPETQMNSRLEDIMHPKEPDISVAVGYL